MTLQDEISALIKKYNISQPEKWLLIADEKLDTDHYYSDIISPTVENGYTGEFYFEGEEVWFVCEDRDGEAYTTHTEPHYWSHK